MVTEILLAGGIILYTGWVIWRKIRDRRNGKVCGGCCAECSMCRKK